MMVLGEQLQDNIKTPVNVSILLVMDDGLGGLSYLFNVETVFVSILLVMDDGLGGSEAQGGSQETALSQSFL